MPLQNLTDIGVMVAGKVALDPYTSTAGGSGDASAANGLAIDRLAMASIARSCKIQLIAVATLAATKLATIVFKLQQSDDGSTGWTDYTYDPGGATVGAVTVVLTGGSGGTTERKVLEANYDLSGAKRWIRLTVTPDLNAATVDTLLLAGLINFGGDVMPASVA